MTEESSFDCTHEGHAKVGDKRTLDGSDIESRLDLA